MVYDKYRKDVYVTKTKSDQTLVTSVDEMVHEEVSRCLSHFFPDVRILSEEGDLPSYNERKKITDYWLLDPIDGTMEFIDETDEFVISLGYISNSKPTMGILHHPVSGKSWIGIKERGVFTQEHGGEIIPIQPMIENETYRILVSSRTNDSELTKVIVRQREQELGKKVVVQPVGSALKCGYLVDGRGDEYIRFNEMYDWDFAAGHTIVEAAGFTVATLDPSDTIQYGTPTMKIPPLSIRKYSKIEVFN